MTEFDYFCYLLCPEALVKICISFSEARALELRFAYIFLAIKVAVQ